MFRSKFSFVPSLTAYLFFSLTRSDAAPVPASEYVGWCLFDSIPIPNGEYIQYGIHPSTYRVASGQFIKARCNPGYRLVGEDILECGTNGSFVQQPTCKDIDECNMISNKVGSNEVASYSFTSSDVNEPSSWQDSPAEEAYPCPAPAKCVNTKGSFSCQCPGEQCYQFTLCDDEVNTPEFGKILEQSRVHVTFACNVGYRLLGNQRRICIDGIWDGNQTTCEALTCEPPSSTILNGMSNINETRIYQYGDKVLYDCNESYRLVGNTYRVCTTKSTVEGADTTYWTGQDPSCQVIRCSNPGVIQHGKVSVSSQLIGGLVRFECHSGYQLIGSSIRGCQANGKWNGTMTTCNDPNTFCLTPAIPFNGWFTGSSSYELGDVILFGCNAGFDLIGSRERQCTTFGQWSGEQPICLGDGEYNDVKQAGDQLGQTALRYRDEFQSRPPKPLAGRGRLLGPMPEFTDSGGLDIYFIFDVSGSVQVDESYIEAIDFAKAFVNKTGVSLTGEGGTRYGAVAYATEAIVVFHSNGVTVEEVHQSLEGIKHTAIIGKLGRGTATAKGLQMIHTHMIPHTKITNKKRHIRQNTHTVVFLLTDGKSNMGGSPLENASKLKNYFDVDIHCIGIGNSASTYGTELNQIASKPENEHVFYLKDCRSLDELTHKIINTQADFHACGVSRGPRNLTTTTAEDVWPWQAAIYTYQTLGLPRFFCGGSLVARKWILSAAHCFDFDEDLDHANRDNAKRLEVYMGTNKRIVNDDVLPLRVQSQKVKRIIIHPNYNTSSLPKYDYDVALLELQEPFKLSTFVRTVCLPPEADWGNLLTPGESNKPFATGWGKKRYEDNEKYSKDLKQLPLPIRSENDQFCRVLEWDRFGNLTERMLCAGYSDGSLDTCKGDSGGPLVRKWHDRWYQVGIVSWGFGCARKKQYGYYTHVPRVVTWVEKYVNNGSFPGVGTQTPSPA